MWMNMDLMIGRFIWMRLWRCKFFWLCMYVCKPRPIPFCFTNPIPPYIHRLDTFENNPQVLYHLPVPFRHFLDSLESQVLGQRSGWLGSLFRSAVKRRPSVPINQQEHTGAVIQVVGCESGPVQHVFSFLTTVEINSLAASCKVLRLHHHLKDADDDNAKTDIDGDEGPKKRKRHRGRPYERSATRGRHHHQMLAERDIYDASASIRRVKNGIWGAQSYVSLPQSVTWTSSVPTWRRWIPSEVGAAACGDDSSSGSNSDVVVFETARRGGGGRFVFCRKTRRHSSSCSSCSSLSPSSPLARKRTIKLWNIECRGIEARGDG